MMIHPRCQRGFSLLEVLVAFTILSVSLGVLLQIFSTGLRNAALTEELQRRGFEVVSNNKEADVFLVWHLVTQERTDVRNFNQSPICFFCCSANFTLSFSSGIKALTCSRPERSFIVMFSLPFPNTEGASSFSSLFQLS